MKTRKIIHEYLYEVKLTPYIDYTKLGPVAKINKVKKPIGIVIAIGPSILGWSLCNKLDVFDKEEAMKLALIRAELIEYLDPSEDLLEGLYQDMVPVVLHDLIFNMNERSIKYFKN